MVRIWFKDGNYMDVPSDRAWEYESQPDWDRTDDEVEMNNLYKESFDREDKREAVV